MRSTTRDLYCSFGIFGIPGKVPSNPAMNYAGVAIAVASVALYAAIKPVEHKEEDLNDVESDYAHSSGGLCNFSRFRLMPQSLRRVM